MPFPHPRGYVCSMCPEPPTFGLGLEEGAWADAPWSEDFVDIEGPEKSKPRHRTRVKMLWDNAYFYIGAELEESHLWATLTEHDSVIFQDNDFEVFIDPDGDNHQYYEYEINALGTDWDLRLVKPYRDGGPALNSWEILGLKKRVTLHGTLNDPRDVDEGWTVEIAFPWEVLAEYAGRPAPPEIGDQWRVNFSRVQWQLTETEHGYEKIQGIPEDNWVWSPQWAVDMHRPEFWGYVQFERTHKPFREDEDWGVKCDLMELYYEQKVFHEKHGVWAETSELTNTTNGSVRLSADGAGFRASLIGNHGVYTVDQESRLTLRRH